MTSQVSEGSQVTSFDICVLYRPEKYRRKCLVAEFSVQRYCKMSMGYRSYKMMSNNGCFSTFSGDNRKTSRKDSTCACKRVCARVGGTLTGNTCYACFSEHEVFRQLFQ